MAETKLISANTDEAEGIAWLTLNRPEKKNALSIALLSELAGILRSLADNDKIRCIVTMGAGDSYSSGRDLYDMRNSQTHRRRSQGMVPRRRPRDDQRPRPRDRRGHRQVRDAGSHSRQLRRHCDAEPFSWRNSNQEGLLYL